MASPRPTGWSPPREGIPSSRRSGGCGHSSDHRRADTGTVCASVDDDEVDLCHMGEMSGDQGDSPDSPVLIANGPCLQGPRVFDVLGVGIRLAEPLGNSRQQAVHVLGNLFVADCAPAGLGHAIQTSANLGAGIRPCGHTARPNITSAWYARNHERYRQPNSSADSLPFGNHRDSIRRIAGFFCHRRCLAQVAIGSYLLFRHVLSEQICHSPHRPTQSRRRSVMSVRTHASADPSR